jgi:hypothetical protein
VAPLQARRSATMEADQRDRRMHTHRHERSVPGGHRASSNKRGWEEVHEQEHRASVPQRRERFGVEPLRPFTGGMTGFGAELTMRPAGPICRQLPLSSH